MYKVKPLYFFDFYNWILLNNIADPRWWLLFISIFWPWIVWWKLIAKKRLFEILAYGLLWAAMATWLDLLGTSNGMWEYPFKLYHKVSCLLPADVSVIPVLFMLLYQYGERWRTFLLGSVIVSTLLSFIFEPIFLKMNMLNLITWTHIKSWVSFIFLALVTRLIITLLKKAQRKFLVD
ncbi:CBO0543 family protein [Sutcliffiella halmapala]